MIPLLKRSDIGDRGVVPPESAQVEDRLDGRKKRVVGVLHVRDIASFGEGGDHDARDLGRDLRGHCGFPVA